MQAVVSRTEQLTAFATAQISGSETESARKFVLPSTGTEVQLFPPSSDLCKVPLLDATSHKLCRPGGQMSQSRCFWQPASMG
jgi:hypothetical protein